MLRDKNKSKPEPSMAKRKAFVAFCKTWIAIKIVRDERK